MIPNPQLDQDTLRDIEASNAAEGYPVDISIELEILGWILDLKKLGQRQGVKADSAAKEIDPGKLVGNSPSPMPLSC